MLKNKAWSALHKKQAIKIMGRKPKATEVKRASGAFAKDPQRENKNEPKPIRRAPEKPEILLNDSIASEKWDSLCVVLDQLGLIASSDLELMELFCISWSRYRKLLAIVEDEGFTIFDDKGNRKRNPSMIELNAIEDKLRRLVAEFGLTPSSRSRLVSVKREEKTEFQNWLEKRNNLN
jgi:P27 family predicted phage terminase small subunit